MSQWVSANLTHWLLRSPLFKCKADNHKNSSCVLSALRLCVWLSYNGHIQLSDID